MLLGRKAIGLSVILFLFMFTSCTYFSEYAKLERSARAAYARADYDTAVMLLTQSLQLEQGYDKSQFLMADAFLMANKVHLKNIAQLESSTNDFKYDGVSREYRRLMELHEAVSALPPIRHPKTGVRLEFEIIDYTQKLMDSNQKAAEAHYLAGEKLAASPGLEEQKSAAKQFKKALSFVPDYKDAEERYSRSRKAGVKRIAVFPFEDLSGKNRAYGAIEELVVDEMVASVMRDPASTEFLELISRDQLDRVLEEQKLGLSGLVSDQTAVEVGAILGVHEILTGKITQIIYSPVRTVDRDFKETKKIVIKTEKYQDSEGKTKTRNVYGTVEAWVKQYTRTTKAEIKGSYKIVDVKTSKVLVSESFNGSSDFSTKWAEVRGDTRALKASTARLARTEEVIAPVATEMVSRAASDLANSLSNSLKIYAR